MVVGLIIFCTVTHGVAGMRDLGKVGRIAVNALVYFEVVTTLALVIGLVTINVLKPGIDMHIDPASLHADAKDTAPAAAVGFGDSLVSLVPTLLRYFREELVLVLGTSSSESVFPQLTGKLTKLGVDESVVGLVLPTAYSFNHDGTCLYFAAVSVFLAQATGTDLGWQAQLGLLLVLLVTSKGGAGVSGSAIAVLALTLAATRTIPVSSVALVLGIHRVLSAAFVFTNIAGNTVATLVVGKWEKAVDRDRLRTELDAGYRSA